MWDRNEFTQEIMVNGVGASTYFGVIELIMSAYSIHEMTAAGLTETLHQETWFPRARTEEPN